MSSYHLKWDTASSCEEEGSDLASDRSAVLPRNSKFLSSSYMRNSVRVHSKDQPGQPYETHRASLFSSVNSFMNYTRSRIWGQRLEYGKWHDRLDHSVKALLCVEMYL